MATGIQWTDETWNPVTGCSRVSPGCDNCYMFALYPRLRGMGVPGYDTAPDHVSIWRDRLEEPLTWKKPRRVFVNSMSDLFHRDVPGDFIFDAFRIMETASARGHIFQILTKRPGQAAAWWDKYSDEFPDGWPEGIWLGTSVESQKYAPRLDVLARVPAPVRFVSAEPLLDRVDLRRWLDDGTLDWVIVGGESGMRARPLSTAWVEEIVNDCNAAEVAVFVKQLGTSWARVNQARDSKGGNAAEWPTNLRVRQFPTTRNIAISA